MSNRQTLPILAYHRVIDFDENTPFDFEVSNVSATPPQFEKQLAFLKAHFNPITFGELKANRFEGTPLPPHPVMITFDDGYKDNFTKAFPLLNKYGLKATFFLTAGFIGSDQLFPFERLSYSLNKTSHSSIDLSSFKLGRLPISTPQERIKARQIIIHYLRSLDETTHQAVFQTVMERLDVTVPAGTGHSQIMNWDDIVEMSRHGMEFGSHSMTHPILSRVPSAQLKDETQDSKDLIEARLNKPIDAFCYPASGKTDYFGVREEEALKSAGYHFGVTFLHGLENTLSMNPYQIRRIRIPHFIGESQFKIGVSFPRMII